jgi:hypothetical protein
LKLSVLPLNYTLLTEDEDIYLFRGKQGLASCLASLGREAHYIYLKTRKLAGV